MDRQLRPVVAVEPIAVPPHRSSRSRQRRNTTFREVRNSLSIALHHISASERDEIQETVSGLINEIVMKMALIISVRNHGDTERYQQYRNQLFGLLRSVL